VDYFKQINDVKGHQAGDKYLASIAGALRSALPRATDFLARYGGEEFSVILPATNSAGAAATAKKLHQCIAALGLAHPQTPSGTVTVSIGLSTFDGTTQHAPANLIRTADRALYRAKQRGRNRSEFLALENAEKEH
jgi:diguanylate cyclase (GGDEF)-like protein